MSILFLEQISFPGIFEDCYSTTTYKDQQLTSLSYLIAINKLQKTIQNPEYTLSFSLLMRLTAKKHFTEVVIE